MKKALISTLVMSLFLIFQAASQTTVPGGQLSILDWTASGSPYRITGDVTVDSQDTLKIEPGVIIDFEGEYRIRVEGLLFAHGTKTDSIRFTRLLNDGSLKPDTAGFADTSNFIGGWKGIEFENSNFGDTSRMNYCIVEYGKTIDNKAKSRNDLIDPVNVYSSTNLILSNSVFRYNLVTTTVVWVKQGTILFDSCHFHHNTAYENKNIIFTWSSGAIWIKNSDRTTVQNCEFSWNKSQGVGAAGGIYLSNSNILIIGNFFHNNSSTGVSGVGGGAIVMAHSNPKIIQNVIVNNESYHAGGIYYQWSGGKLINNTICNNKSDVSGGVEYEGYTGCIAHNNLIYGNVRGAVPSEVNLQSETAQPIYRNNLLGNSFDDITSSYEIYIEESENYFGDPSIVNPTTTKGPGETSNLEDWRIEEGSLVINKGLSQFVDLYDVTNDVEGFRRMNYGVVDIGASEFRLASYNPGSSIISPETWVADTVFITSDLAIDAKVTIYPGVVVCFVGNHEWDVRDTLMALGNERAPIQFTIDDTTGFADETTNDGGWGPIRFYYVQRPKVFEYVKFQFGKNYNTTDSRGIFYIFSGNVLFKSCEFTDCFGINTGIIYSFSGSNIELNSCTLYNNSTSSWHSLINFSGSNFRLVGNRIFNNSCGNTVNLICAHSSMNNNSIYNNKYGVSVTGQNFDFTGNTVWNTGNVTFGDGDFVRIKNSIIGPGKVNFNNNLYSIRSSYAETWNHTGDVADLITEPVFINPTSYSGTGPLEEVMHADYSLSAISPGVNEGSPDTLGLNIPRLDIDGDPRIHDGRIDVGAYENQDGIPKITMDPVGGLFCTGDTHLLAVNYIHSDSAIFEWVKDGVPVTGSNTRQLVFDSLTLADEGNFQCMIRNAYGEVRSNPVFMKVGEAPRILLQPGDSWRQPGKQVNFSTVFEGSAPLQFQWSLNGSPIPGASLPEYRFVPADSNAEGMYSCRISNACGTVETDSFSMYLAPQLCMVTVSESSGDNLIIWEKKTRAPVFAYNIYRESSAAGIYDLLGTVPYEELSTFVDSFADPTVQAYLYKITALDEAGNETDADLCRPHKTIHLLISTNPELNTTQLGWDRYYGFDYQTYYIYRSTDWTSFEIIDSLASSINSWTDPNPGSGTMIYRISVKKPELCAPEQYGKKAGTGPYQHSLSNMDDNKLKTGQNPPDSIWIDNLSIIESSMPGSLVGRIYSSDPDTTDVHTYKLVEGTGDDGNPSFTITADLLLSAANFDYESKSEYSIRVRTTDPSQNSFEKAFVVTILEDTGTGLEGLSADKPAVYPNPAVDKATISLPGEGIYFWQLRVLDFSGKTVYYESNISGKSHELDCSNFRNGLYILELQGKHLYRLKLIVE